MGDGTAVAQEAGDVVILNNSLASIKDCVFSTAGPWHDPLAKFLIFQLTVNISTLADEHSCPHSWLDGAFLHCADFVDQPDYGYTGCHGIWQVSRFWTALYERSTGEENRSHSDRLYQICNRSQRGVYYSWVLF